MQDLAKKILGKIKTEKIKPISKWKFIFKKSFVWSLFSLSSILGGLAFGSILVQIKHTEWDIYHYFDGNFSMFLFYALPYVWILCLILFSTLAYYYLRHTSKGYRYNTVIVITLSIFLSITGGSALFASGISEKIETSFQNNFPFYPLLHRNRMLMWGHPEKGILGGKIIQEPKELQLELEDFRNKNWIIDISKANIKPNIILKKDTLIKIIGEQKNEQIFQANEIRPWGPLPNMENCLKHNATPPPCHQNQNFLRKNERKF